MAYYNLFLKSNQEQYYGNSPCCTLLPCTTYLTSILHFDWLLLSLDYELQVMMN